MSDPTVAARAAELGRRIRAEDGVAEAVAARRWVTAVAVRPGTGVMRPGGPDDRFP